MPVLLTFATTDMTDITLRWEIRRLPCVKSDFVLETRIRDIRRQFKINLIFDFILTNWPSERICMSLQKILMASLEQASMLYSSRAKVLNPFIRGTEQFLSISSLEKLDHMILDLIA